MLRRRPPVTRRSWLLKGSGQGGAAGETTSARVGAHCPPPDAIRGALAACRSWENLPRGCITPARFATEVEPSQSAGELGLGQVPQLPTQRAARLTGKQNTKVIGQKGDLPRPNHRDSWRGGRGPSWPEGLKGASEGAA